LVKCSCGFIFLDPIPEEATLKNYYDNLPNPPQLDASPIEYEKSMERINLAERSLDKPCRKWRILDVGSGSSNFLSIAKARGWDAYSLEIREDAKTLMRKEGIKVIDNIPNIFFDAITLNQVLEHLPNPLENLKIYHRKLVTNGIMIVEVPNIDSLGIKLLKDKWYFIKNPEHISYFSEDTLILMLEKAGFEIIKAEFLGATLVTDFASSSQSNAKIIFNFYRNFKGIINPFIGLFNKTRFSDTLRVVAQK